jgi:S-formylglutathione hydrolase
MDILKTHAVFGGNLHYLKHDSAVTGTPMSLSVFVPPAGEGTGTGRFPVVYFLSGLTCTEDNFTTKAGAYQAAAKLGLIVVAPDTSPRGEGVADVPDYDLGQGAGFYVDATQSPWTPHFRMESYVVDELVGLIDSQFPTTGQRGITGHSMGGHGALTLALRHPALFRSVSALAPICSPNRCPWGEKAFSAYLGQDRSLWADHDASLLIAAGRGLGHFDDILIDQGEADPFLAEQLKPDLLSAAAIASGQRVTFRLQPGYDHSYFFIASVIDDHLAFHAARLGG